MSDHSSFIATLNETAKLCQPKGQINYGSYRKFDIDNFKNDLTNSDLIQNPDPNSVISLYTQYHDTMSTLLDKHAPLKSCKVTSNVIPVNEWITDEILLSKRKKGSWKEYGEGIKQILIDHDSMHKFISLTDYNVKGKTKTIIHIWFQRTSQTLESYGAK